MMAKLRKLFELHRLKALNIKAKSHPNNHRQAVGLRQVLC